MAFQDLAQGLGLSEESINSIPEELRTDKSLEPIKDLPGLIKSYSDGQKFIGGSIRIPKEDAKPEEVEAFYTKLGRPAKAEEYKLNLPYPEYVQWDKERIAGFTQAAHRAGMTVKQAQAVIDAFGQQVASDFQAKKNAFESAQATLKTEWGGAYDRNLALAKRVRDMYGGEELKAFFADDPSGNDPRVIRFLAKLGNDLEAGDYLGGPGESTGLTPDEAKEKINEVMRNKDDLYHAKFADKPGHKERVEEVQAWYAVAYNAV